jgi:predicted DNA-binding transcriptional regulator AlpA
MSHLLDRKATCTLFGGNRPINASTLYRWISQGKVPAPVKVGPSTSRWVRSECEACLQTMIAGRAV